MPLSAFLSVILCCSFHLYLTWSTSSIILISLFSIFWTLSPFSWTICKPEWTQLKNFTFPTFLNPWENYAIKIFFFSSLWIHVHQYSLGVLLSFTVRSPAIIILILWLFPLLDLGLNTASQFTKKKRRSSLAFSGGLLWLSALPQMKLSTVIICFQITLSSVPIFLFI